MDRDLSAAARAVPALALPAMIAAAVSSASAVSRKAASLVPAARASQEVTPIGGTFGQLAGSRLASSALSPQTSLEVKLEFP
jgi:hypothetical protein